MSAQSGMLFLLQIGDGASPENFSTVGGLKTTGFKLNNKILISNNLESGQWQRAIVGGIQALAIDASGIFTDSTAEENLREKAFNASLSDYQLIFGNGDTLLGSFAVNSFERSGEYGDAEIYSITLESTGNITYTRG